VQINNHRFLKEWNLKLASEVSQLLQLTSMELEAFEFEVECVMKEKQWLVDQARIIWMFMELM
jgi:hypothetical protein